MYSKRCVLEHLKRGWDSRGVDGSGERRIVTALHQQMETQRAGRRLFGTVHLSLGVVLQRSRELDERLWVADRGLRMLPLSRACRPPWRRLRPWGHRETPARKSLKDP